MVDYINELLTEDEFLNKVYARSKSLDSKNVHPRQQLTISVFL